MRDRAERCRAVRLVHHRGPVAVEGGAVQEVEQRERDLHARSLSRVPDPLEWLDAPCVMGILNVTPDSLWAGAGPIGEGEAAARLLAMRDDGAAICDVGAESTRPGSDPVPPEEQLRRLAGVLRAMRGPAAGVPVSVDTSLGARWRRRPSTRAPSWSTT